MPQQRINVSANVLSVSFTPFARVMRTLIQILVSVSMAIPIILNTPGVSGNVSLIKDLGILGGLIAAVTAIWNALESYGFIPAAGGKPATPIVADVVAANNASLAPRKVPSLY